ncbi:MAG: metal-dependent phosphohydrolase region [Gemmatimonadetes bacterium]|nr:metal-dependent phosphohydrolase region [Gemmatimonadota bacterium]
MRGRRPGVLRASGAVAGTSPTRYPTGPTMRIDSAFGEGRITGAALALAGALGAAWAVDARRRGKEARSMHRTLVDLLLNALTADDPSTARHSRRVADLSYALAAVCGMRGREMATLRVAALLHDLGKMDDRFEEMVRSSERLTPAQRREMEDHPHESAHIIGPLEKLHPGIGRIVASHHERWDGTGYPAGLRGEQIPREARIISVADVFDALSQPRSYHDALPVGEVLAKLRESAGTQFDPELVALAGTPSVMERWSAIARDGLRCEKAERAREKAQSDASEARQRA